MLLPVPEPELLLVSFSVTLEVLVWTSAEEKPPLTAPSLETALTPLLVSLEVSTRVAFWLELLVWE